MLTSRPGWLVVALLMAAVAGAQPSVPPVLQDWTGWALHGAEHRQCPFLLGRAAGEPAAHVCAWPGQMQLDVDAGGARFALDWTVLAEAELVLPGDARLRPRDVRVDGRAAPVLMRRGQPMLRLGAGRYRIEGQLEWSQRPSQLPVPEAIALVGLRLDGRDIELPEREGGRLWLGRGETRAGADTLALRVFRLLHDGVPMRLSTEIAIEVSGRAREVTLGRALPDGFVPMALETPLPAVLGADGMLRAQLRPGTWRMRLEARAQAQPDAVGPSANVEPWPTEEIWSWRAAPGLRVVQVRGEMPVDPAQVGVPWDEALPSYVLAGDGRLVIEQRSRGLDPERAHRLQLQRELWLDFDGTGITARDRIDGQLAQPGRLDMAAPWALLRASIDGADLLVTEGPDGRPGVELRNPRLALEATARLPGRVAAPAVAWAQDFESVHASMHLPPGWRLLHAEGADRAPQAWIARWSLLDLFLLALAALLAHRVHGIGFAALVAGFLTLGYHEPGSPLWSLLGVLLASLFLRVLPTGRLAALLRALRWGLFGLVVLLALPFSAGQLKLALYPQLEFDRVGSAREGYGPGGAAYRGKPQSLDAELASVATESSAPLALDRAARAPAAPAAPPPPPKRPVEAYPSDAILQAGPGTPDWSWQRVELYWSGPVLATQPLELWLAPPWLTRLLRLALVLLLGLALARLVRDRAGPAPAAVSSAATALVVGALTVLAPPPAYAQAMPSPELLETLRDRLLEPPRCMPDCASLDSAEVVAGSEGLQLELILHAEAALAVPLPDAEKAAIPVRAELGGAEVPVRSESGQRWVQLPRGVHRLAVEYRVAAVEQLDLRFPMLPGRIAVQAPDWEIVGTDGPRLSGDTLQLVRRRGAVESAESAVAAQEFPPFVQVTRSLQLDLDWTVFTRVDRLAPRQAGFSLRLPLLPGERVLDDSREVVEQAIRLDFAAGEVSHSWRSRLPIGESIALSMDDLGRRSERWEVQVGPFWHAEFAGVPELAEDHGDGVRRFVPLPGETLAIGIRRPRALPGSAVAIDDAQLRYVLGERAGDSHLSVSLRSTRGGQHVFGIPADAELVQVEARGEVLNLRSENGKVSVPVVPGTQRITLHWRSPHGTGWRSRSDPVELGAAVANLRTEVAVPGNRWLLATHGSGVGPALLYWPQLALMLLVAWALSRLSASTPLRFHHWLLLGLGFSTVSWLAVTVVAGWLLLLGWRRQRAQAIATHPTFALVQIGVVLASVLALLCLVAAIPYGLLGAPDMQVTGNGSSAFQLNWTLDRSDGQLPAATLWSLPLWVYKVAILLWALWLANALVGWLRWAWQCWSAEGYWPPRKAKAAAPPPRSASVAAEAAEHEQAPPASDQPSSSPQQDKDPRDWS